MAGVTTKSNLVIPEVMGAVLRDKMIDSIKLAPLAVVNTELEATPGDTITVPYYAYIGDAVDLAENTAGDVDLLTATTKTATVKKVFKAVEVTDEAIGASTGDPTSEIERQLAMALASKVEKDCYTALEAATNTVDLSATDTVEISPEGISDAAIALFGEDMDGIFCFVHPKQYGKIRKNENFIHIKQGDAVISGEVGMLYGVRIVVSNRVTNGTNIFMKLGGLMITLKKDVDVETDRDILKKTTVVSADRHYVAHIYDASKVGVATFKATA